MLSPTFELCNGLLNLHPPIANLPFQIHVLEIIVNISQDSHLKFPIYPHIYRLLQSKYFYINRFASKGKEFDFEIKIKCTSKEVLSQKFWEEMLDRLLYLILIQVNELKNVPGLRYHSMAYLKMLKKMLRMKTPVIFKKKLVHVVKL